MIWELGLPNVHHLMAVGKDNEKRIKLFLELIEKYKNSTKKCLQVGVFSGDNSKYGSAFTSIDLYDKRDCIDFNESIEDTTFKDNTFDLIICKAILEHVLNPFKAAKEMSRITKKNGLVWAEVPFVQPYHPTKKKYEPSDGLLIDGYNTDGPNDFNHGGDYWRFTPQGICQLMKPFTPIEVMLCNDGGITFYGGNEK